MTTKQRELLRPHFSDGQLEQLEKISEFLQTEDFFEVGIQTLKGLNLYDPLVNFLLAYYKLDEYADDLVCYWYAVEDIIPKDELVLQYSFLPKILNSRLHKWATSAKSFTYEVDLPLFLKSLCLNHQGFIISNSTDIDYPIIANGLIENLPLSTIEQHFKSCAIDFQLESISSSAEVIRCEGLNTIELCWVDMSPAIGCKKLYVGAESIYDFCFRELILPPNLEEITINCKNLDIDHFKMLFRCHKQSIKKWTKVTLVNLVDSAIEQYFKKRYVELFGEEVLNRLNFIILNN